MKRVITGAVLVLGLGGCVDSEPVELDLVKIHRTDEGVVLVAENGEEFTVDDGDVEMDIPNLPATSELTAQPDPSAAWVCDKCTCNEWGCICTDCKETKPEKEK